MGQTGCSSRPQAAQKMFANGQYQEVIDRYPDLEIARRAHAKLAEDLFAKGDYDAVIRQYTDTPAAYKARQALAEKLFNEGRYQELLDQFPHAQLALVAKERLADSLFAAGNIDEILIRFADTEKGKQVKEERGREELAKAKKLSGPAREQAIQNIMTFYAGTEASKEAGRVLTEIRQQQVRNRK